MVKLNDSLLSMKQAAKLVPSRRSGRPCSSATLWRWAMRGVRGIRLESLCVGGSLMTSAEALEDFFRRLAEARYGPEPSSQPTIRERNRANDLAAMELKAMGV
jgi:hypothetical protein